MSVPSPAPGIGDNSVLDVEKQDFHESKKPVQDVRSKAFFGSDIISRLSVKDGEVYEVHPERHPKWYQRLLDAGVEENGIKPVPVEQRTVTQYSNLFTVFFASLLNLLPWVIVQCPLPSTSLTCSAFQPVSWPRSSMA